MFRRIFSGIRRGLANTIAKRMPLYIMVDGDIAQTLGAILRDEMHIDSEILVIDRGPAPR